MKRILFTILVVSFFSLIPQSIKAQQKGDVRIGGGVGVNFGNNGYFGVNVSPSIGYVFTDNLEAGAIVGYDYAADDFVKQNLFNVGAYSNFYFLNNLFARGEYSYFTGNAEAKNSDAERDINESTLWLGGGYRQNIAGAANLFIGVQYNVLYDEDDSIFSSAWRPFVGIGIGF